MVTTPNTPFTLDITARYVCNTLDEAIASIDRTTDADARPFDIIVIGGGTFGAALACHIFNHDVTHAHRILVLQRDLAQEVSSRHSRVRRWWEHAAA